MQMLKQIILKLNRWLAWPLLLLIKLYQWVLSPWLGNRCRFTPTCSVYAREALQKYGLFKGLYLAVSRLLRCHPFGGSGYDPVP